MIIDNYFKYEDERGKILGITNSESWQEINYVETSKGALRGGHYHKNTKEMFYMIEGEVLVELENIIDGKKNSYNLKAGDIFSVEPNVLHKIISLTDTKWINLLSNPMDKDNPDIHHLS